MACQGSRRCQRIAAAAATDALSTCIGDDAGLSRRPRRTLLRSNSLCCGSTMSRHLGDTCCSIHTHNLHSSWDKVRTSSGVFLYSMNESTLLTKAVSALVFRRFTTAAAAAAAPPSIVQRRRRRRSLRPEDFRKNNRSARRPGSTQSEIIIVLQIYTCWGMGII